LTKRDFAKRIQKKMNKKEDETATGLHVLSRARIKIIYQAKINKLCGFLVA
jgi:hypothetical protein